MSELWVLMRGAKGVGVTSERCEAPAVGMGPTLTASGRTAG